MSGVSRARYGAHIAEAHWTASSFASSVEALRSVFSTIIWRYGIESLEVNRPAPSAIQRNMSLVETEMERIGVAEVHLFPCRADCKRVSRFHQQPITHDTI